MIQLLSDHWESVIHLIVVIVGGVGLYYALTGDLKALRATFAEFTAHAQEHWKRLEDELKNLDQRLSNHLLDPLPHRSCPAHNARMEDVIARLDRVQMDVRDIRTVVINTNFHVKKEEE